MLRFGEIFDIIAAIQYPGYTFTVEKDMPVNGLYLQAEFLVEDSNGPLGSIVKHKTRKWRLSYHMTKSELVQTALLCVLASVEHEARERFLYQGRAIFGPHHDVEKLWEITTESMLDMRS